jgi:DNA-binding transcriptional ArsR family regulator
VRWRLLGALARGDRQVHEPTALLGEQQSLISYHLGLLRKADLVRARRSSADGSDTYYRLDLARRGQLLAATGGALHPGLRLTAPPAVAGVTPTFAGHPATAHWSIPDPAADPDGRPAFERVAAELTERIDFLLHTIATEPAEEAS